MSWLHHAQEYPPLFPPLNCPMCPLTTPRVVLLIPVLSFPNLPLSLTVHRRYRCHLRRRTNRRTRIMQGWHPRILCRVRTTPPRHPRSRIEGVGGEGASREQEPLDEIAGNHRLVAEQTSRRRRLLSHMEPRRAARLLVRGRASRGHRHHRGIRGDAQNSRRVYGSGGRDRRGSSNAVRKQRHQPTCHLRNVRCAVQSRSSAISRGFARLLLGTRTAIRAVRANTGETRLGDENNEFEGPNLRGNRKGRRIVPYQN